MKETFKKKIILKLKASRNLFPHNIVMKMISYDVEKRWEQGILTNELREDIEWGWRHILVHILQMIAAR